MEIYGDLARALIAHLQASESEKERTFWAWERVEGLIDDGRADDAWSVISDAIEAADGDRELVLIGGGVLESLVVTFPEEIVPRLIERAKDSAKMRRAARSMYLSDLTEGQADVLRQAIRSSDS